jgi:hypothetical protein
MGTWGALMLMATLWSPPGALVEMTGTLGLTSGGALSSGAILLR